MRAARCKQLHGRLCVCSLFKEEGVRAALRMFFSLRKKAAGGLKEKAPRLIR